MIDNTKIQDFTDCDGKKCGLGKYFGGGKYVCPHNNLQVKHPELIKQWHPDNKPMSSYTRGSAQKVWWICELNYCGCHIWESMIMSRTKKNPSGCPYCSKRHIPCIHNNLEVQFPDLKIEWDPENSKKMNEYTSHSEATVLWICKDSPCKCHKWAAIIYHRTKKIKPTGCPYCKNKKVCNHNNFETMFPHLKIEWDPNNVKKMCEYSYGSTDIVSWICPNGKCECHTWKSSINNRTNSDTECPFCSKNTTKICKHNNLEILYPDLKSEWHPDNTKLMTDYTYGSIDKVKWICSKNPSHVWETVIYHRTRKDGTNCPHCSKSKGYSDAEINWITKMEKKENIIIRNALSENRQFKIIGVGKVDSYCQETNTVYEFHGDYWHGNPSIYNRNEINAVTKSTFGELYDKTIERERKIRELGYNLIVKWESDTESKVEDLKDVFYIKINNKSTFTHH